MKKIGIITNIEKDKELVVTKLLCEKLIKAGAGILLPENIAKISGFDEYSYTEESLYLNSDIIISIGGDGTFLSVSRRICTYEKPIMAINAGNLGFLTQADKNDIDTVVNLLLSGNYQISKRMILEARINSGEVQYAVNDVVISRDTIARMINIKISLDDEQIDEYLADGLIVSTPIGSTAYSLSAGGPIVDADMSLMLVTPICPHLLRARSLVISDKRKITVMVSDKSQKECILTIDGQRSFKFTGYDTIEIKKSVYSLNYIKLQNKKIFDILKKKLY